MKFIEWREAFLSEQNRQNLRVIGGVPLYSYKMSALEFADLQDCLVSNLRLYLDRFDINDICARSAEFPALFVLYASNWWQREYDGSGMSWEPIFASVGVNYSTLASNTRSQMIKRGFSYWNLTLNNDIGNLKFIGNIASQGGLPLKLIASDKNGNLNRLLKRTLKEVVNLAFPDKQSIVAMIESHQNELTKSYRQPLIYDLLAEIINTFLHLKNEANLAGSVNPIEKLNQFNPHWRDSFPLPMDDENAKGVLERFVQEGARIKAEKQKFVLKLGRSIRFIGDGFEINAKINLPDQAEDEDTIKHVFGVESEFLSRLMTLEINNATDLHEIAIRRLAGQNKYRFDATTKKEFENALSTHAATLKSDNGSKKLELQYADELDDDSPWVFDADEANQYQFIKMGAGKFKSAKLYVVVHESYRPLEPIVCLGKMHTNPQLVCYELESRTVFSNPGSDRFEIQTDVHNAANDNYVLRGERLWDIFQKPSMAFKGFPQFNKSTQVTPTHETLTPATALCKNFDYKPLNSVGMFGPLHLAVKEQGSQVWTSRIAVLPNTAQYLVLTGDDAKQGRLELIDWSISNLKCLTLEVEVCVTKNSNKMIIECKYVGATAPDEFIHIECFWSDNPKSAIVKLPFPSAGVLAFNANNQKLNIQKPLSLREIYGVRIVSLLKQGNFIELELSLKDSGGIKVDPYNIRLKRDRYQQKLEIRLIDFKDQISDLLYSVDNLDARVEFRVKVPGAKDFRLELTKYDLLMAHAPGSAIFAIQQHQLQLFSPEKISLCEVFACRVDDVDEVIELNQTTTEGIQTGIWEFPVADYADGCWMVFPSVSSSIQFRPMLLPLGESNQAVVLDDYVGLMEAQKIANKFDRAFAINKALEVMIEDFNHHNWGHVEYLANHLGHLNLTSLDIWCAFAKNKRAMAALALREGKLPEQFVKRFADELPFMWEFVSLDAWLDAAFYLHKQILQKWSDNEKFAEDYFKFYLNSKVDDLLADQPALRVMLELVKSKNKLSISQDFQFLLNHPSIFESTQSERLFYQADSELQKLMQSDTHTWPDHFYAEIKAEKHGEHAVLFCEKSYDYREPVINLPIILAISALSDRYAEWVKAESNYLRIKQMKNFDSDWFATAFDITIARAAIKGYVQL